MAVPADPTSDFAAPHGSRVVMTTGLHGSASTWVFNVARELMIATFGAEAVLSFFAETPTSLLAYPGVSGRHIVCKTHRWADLPTSASEGAAAVIVTVRDPRDCVFSLMGRFGSGFAVSVRAIANDCQHAVACADAGNPVLRYENRFFDDPATVRVLARHLDVAVSDSVADAIFDRYRSDAVRTFAAAVSSLPPERRSGDGKPMLFDLVTQIHRTHIGDARVGKWRERLDPQQRAEITRPFVPFLARFGYPAD